MIKRSLFLLFMFILFLNASSGVVAIEGEIRDNIKSSYTQREIEALGDIDFKIYDPFLKREAEYSGVEISLLVENFAKESVSSLKFFAKDGYVVDIAKPIWEEQRVVLVVRDGKEFLNSPDCGYFKLIFPDYLYESRVQPSFSNWISKIEKIVFK